MKMENSSTCTANGLLRRFIAGVILPGHVTQHAKRGTHFGQLEFQRALPADQSCQIGISVGGKLNLFTWSIQSLEVFKDDVVVDPGVESVHFDLQPSVVGGDADIDLGESFGFQQRISDHSRKARLEAADERLIRVEFRQVGWALRMPGTKGDRVRLTQLFLGVEKDRPGCELSPQLIVGVIEGVNYTKFSVRYFS